MASMRSVLLLWSRPDVSGRLLPHASSPSPPSSKPTSVGVRRVPVPARRDRARGAPVPAVRAVLSGCRVGTSRSCSRCQPGRPSPRRLPAHRPHLPGLLGPPQREGVTIQLMQWVNGPSESATSDCARARLGLGSPSAFTARSLPWTARRCCRARSRRGTLRLPPGSSALLRARRQPRPQG